MSRKSTDTKERIVHSAASLFSNHGFAATSIDDVVTAVGITKGAFYHHFKTKEQLCEAVLDLAAEAYQQLADSMQEQSTPSEPLSAWFQRLIEIQNSGQWPYDRLIGRLAVEFGSLNAGCQNKLRLFWNWCRTFYESLVSQAFAARNITPAVDVSTLARLFAATYFGTVWLERCAASEESLISNMENLLSLVLSQGTSTQE